MVDSGLLSAIAYDDPDRQHYHRALAQQLGLPLTILDGHLVNHLRLICEPVRRSASCIGSFRSFCEMTDSQLESLLTISSRINYEKAGTINHFPHPLYRHMKDHFSVRLYESLHLLDRIDLLKGDKITVAPFLLEDCDFNLFLLKHSDSYLVFGPLFTQHEIGEGMYRAHYNLMHSELGRFNDSIRRFWHGDKSAVWKVEDRAIYTVDYLRNVSFRRDRKLVSTILDKIDFTRTALDRFDEFSDACLDTGSSARAAVKALAAMAAVSTTNVDGLFYTKIFRSDSEVESIAIAVTRDAVDVIDAPDEIELPGFEQAYAANMEQAFQNWSQLTSESLARLRNWLHTSDISDEGGGTRDRSPDFGRRLARFLASTFDAFECTIYRALHSDGRAQLQAFGEFFADDECDERLPLMRQHMNDLAGTPMEAASISFRCLNQNEVQYCQFFDTDTLTAVPTGQLISYPRKSKFRFWGQSACAIPIRVNGILWGVLQLVGRRPHSFPEFVRARAEDACDIIGSHLFRTELVSSVHAITKIIGAHELGSGEKKPLIEERLSRVFGAKTFAIIRADPSDSHQVDVFLEDGRDDLVAAERIGDRDYFAPLMDFARGGADHWQGRIGDANFRRRFGPVSRKKFYERSHGDFVYLRKITWDFADATAVPGVVMLTFSHEPGDQDGWQEAIEFACRFVSTITGSLYSSDIWERKLREKIGHELSKTATNLKESVRRLEKFERRDPTVQERSDHDISVVMGDLSRHARALSRYTEILTTHRDMSDFDTDPRLYMIKELRAKWRADPSRKPASFRDLYNTYFFGKADAFNEKGIRVPKLDPSLGFVIKIDDISLGEVLATLADNILKYTCHGTALVIREDSTRRSRGISISNIGLKLERDELMTIFRDTVRGTRARDLFPTQGSGFGLFFAQMSMHLWGCGLRHTQRELTADSTARDDTQWAWQDFTLTFPHHIVSS